MCCVLRCGGTNLYRKIFDKRINIRHLIFIFMNSFVYYFGVQSQFNWLIFLYGDHNGDYKLFVRATRKFYYVFFV